MYPTTVTSGQEPRFNQNGLTRPGSTNIREGQDRIATSSTVPDDYGNSRFNQLPQTQPQPTQPQAPYLSSVASFCVHCGAVISKDALHCIRCGVPITMTTPPNMEGTYSDNYVMQAGVPPAETRTFTFVFPSLSDKLVQAGFGVAAASWILVMILGVEGEFSKAAKIVLGVISLLAFVGSLLALNAYGNYHRGAFPALSTPLRNLSRTFLNLGWFFFSVGLVHHICWLTPGYGNFSNGQLVLIEWWLASFCAGAEIFINASF